ncbi:hypothetical protein EVAR_53555_1 [Eumeta japonica]|uniref:Uncharacterized protein n=1 Tax=Eumeta variegata TaxID=151549 RepID=A0A4C1YSE6_EUMVA|nr:hypothetical protein EVAR_53555_1 [Eumeta japonica]
MLLLRIAPPCAHPPPHASSYIVLRALPKLIECPPPRKASPCRRPRTPPVRRGRRSIAACRFGPVVLVVFEDSNV